MVKKKDFLMVLSAATLLMVIFSTMFLSMKTQIGKQFRVSNASTVPDSMK